MKKAILYACVSSQRQADKDLSIPSQFEQMQKYCREQRWKIVEEISDEGQSGRYAHRKGLQHIMSLAGQKPRPFDVLLVWKLSRFARNVRDAVNLEYELKTKGIELISVSEPIEDTPMGRSFRDIMHVVNQMYSLQLSEDTSRGMLENARRGYWNGSRCPIGYKLKSVIDDKGNLKKRLDIDPNLAPIVKKVFEMYLSGMGYKSIANTLNAEGYRTSQGKPFSNAAISYILKSEYYTGVYQWGKKEKIRLENNHPPIISQGTFDKVQAMLRAKSAKYHPRRVNSRYLLSGLVYCGKCGLAMVGCSAKSGRYFYYGCQNYKKRGKKFCDAQQIPQQKLEMKVLEAIQERLLHVDEIKKIFDIVNSTANRNRTAIIQNLKRKQNQQRDIARRLKHLYDALETGEIPVSILSSRLKELASQKASLELEIANLQTQVSTYQPISYSETEIQTHIRNLKSLFQKGAFEEQRAFLRSFVRRVIITGNDIQIECITSFF